ncbi:hypothetical protein ABDK56_12060 [Sphingomonas sp. ASV193]|uniref:hypothetical protein n=1 Tax=Sphingomonas sp. ASV193 TaxID=3144405 RepID=UPI0032E8645D
MRYSHRMLAFLVAAVLGSAPPIAFSVRDDPTIALKVRDDPASRRFVLELKNTGRKTLCLPPDYWPNRQGSISESSVPISVTIGSQNYPLRTGIDDYFGARVEIASVRPKATIRAFLSYEAFKLPESAVFAPKQLHLTPFAVRC